MPHLEPRGRLRPTIGTPDPLHGQDRELRTETGFLEGGVGVGSGRGPLTTSPRSMSYHRRSSWCPPPTNSTRLRLPGVRPRQVGWETSWQDDRIYGRYVPYPFPPRGSSIWGTVGVSGGTGHRVLVHVTPTPETEGVSCRRHPRSRSTVTRRQWTDPVNPPTPPPLGPPVGEMGHGTGSDRNRKGKAPSLYQGVEDWGPDGEPPVARGSVDHGSSPTRLWARENGLGSVNRDSGTTERDSDHRGRGVRVRVRTGSRTDGPPGGRSRFIVDRHGPRAECLGVGGRGVTLARVRLSRVVRAGPSGRREAGGETGYRVPSYNDGRRPASPVLPHDWHPWTVHSLPSREDNPPVRYWTVLRG